MNSAIGRTTLLANALQCYDSMEYIVVESLTVHNVNVQIYEQSSKLALDLRSHWDSISD